jgi:hypothetical protein
METLEQIARSNAEAAIDQASAYGSLEAAADAYEANAMDTAREQGYRGEDVLRAGDLFRQILRGAK